MKHWTEMRIKSAAIRHKGQIYTGTSHAEIGLKMIDDGVCKPPFPGGDDQGFVTECGEYVRREPALAIAIYAGQVQPGNHTHREKLFSEDLATR